VRHTSHAGIARLVAALGMPLTSTSANRPGGPPAPGAERLVEVFGPEERSGELLVLDGGVLGNVPPSTLVDCTDVMPRLVREGAIPRGELRRAAGRLAP
jgi:L-threonylcarbamoyladenylate synthase